LQSTVFDILLHQALAWPEELVRIAQGTSLRHRHDQLTRVEMVLMHALVDEQVLRRPVKRLKERVDLQDLNQDLLL